MLHHQQDLSIVYERHKELLAEVQQQRLLKMLAVESRANHRLVQSVYYWLGTHLVYWGLQLQGEQRWLLHAHPAPR